MFNEKDLRDARSFFEYEYENYIAVSNEVDDMLEYIENTEAHIFDQIKTRGWDENLIDLLYNLFDNAGLGDLLSALIIIIDILEILIDRQLEASLRV